MRSFWVFCILHEHEILQQIKNAIDDPGPRTNGGGHSGISRPTENLALRRLTTVVKEIEVDGYKIEYPQTVIKVIWYVRARINLNEYLGTIYQARFIYKETWRETCGRLHISQETYNKRIRKIVNMCETYRSRIRGNRKNNEFR